MALYLLRIVFLLLLLKKMCTKKKVCEDLREWIRFSPNIISAIYKYSNKKRSDGTENNC